MAPPLTVVPGMVPTGAGPPGFVTSVTSGSTDAPRGRTALILVASEATWSGGALTTIAFLAGIPSERATESDTTASTPPMPTVPNATTGSRCSLPAGHGDRRAEGQLVQGAHGVGHGDAAGGDALPELARGGRGRGGVTAEAGRVHAEHRGERAVDLDLGGLDRLGAGDPGLPGHRGPDPGGQRERRDDQQVRLLQAAQRGDRDGSGQPGGGARRGRGMGDGHRDGHAVRPRCRRAWAPPDR